MKSAWMLGLLAAGSLAAEHSLVEGNPQSAVRVVIYEDLQCSDCANFRRMMDEQLLPRYKAKVAFEHRDFPLAKHAWARKAAIAARFFQGVRPELGLEFRKHALATLRETTLENLPECVAAFAASHGVDRAKALAAMDDARYASLVEDDYQDGVARGIAKTPTVFVNGQPFIERFSVEEISKAIDAAISGSKQ